MVVTAKFTRFERWKNVVARKFWGVHAWNIACMQIIDRCIYLSLNWKGDLSPFFHWPLLINVCAHFIVCTTISTAWSYRINLSFQRETGEYGYYVGVSWSYYCCIVVTSLSLSYNPTVTIWSDQLKHYYSLFFTENVIMTLSKDIIYVNC